MIVSISIRENFSTAAPIWATDPSAINQRPRFVHTDSSNMMWSKPNLIEPILIYPNLT